MQSTAKRVLPLGIFAAVLFLIFGWSALGQEKATLPQFEKVIQSASNAGVEFGVRLDGVYKSVDGGQTWSRMPLPPELGKVGGFATHPFDSSVLFVGTSQGLFKNKDGGTSWQKLEKGLPQGTAVSAIAISPREPANMLIATPFEGVFRSVDRGNSWGFASAGLVPIAGTPRKTDVVDLMYDSRDPSTAYALSEFYGPFRTTDGGQNWYPANAGLPVPLTHRTSRSLLLSRPDAAGVLYLVLHVPVHTHLVVPKLFKSVDHGATWREMEQLKQNVTYSTLALDPGNLGVLILGSDMGYLRVADEAGIDQLPKTEDEVRQVPAAMKLSERKPNLSRRGLNLSEGKPLAEEALVTKEALVPGIDEGVGPAGPVAIEPDFNSGDIVVIHDDGPSSFLSIHDLNNKSLLFTPNSQGGYTITMASPSFDTTLGTDITADFNVLANCASLTQLLDDCTTQRSLGFSFSFYGIGRTSVFINSNGNLTFGGGDFDRTESFGDLGNFPRIAVLWHDLTFTSLPPGGGMFFKTLVDRAVITWNQVRESGIPASFGTDTVQVVLFSDGRIQINHGQVVSTAGMVGIGSIGLVNFSLDYTRDLPVSVPPSGIAEQFFGTIFTTIVAQRFYQSAGLPHPDAYDFLVVWGSSSFEKGIVGSPFAFAFEQNVSNFDGGIGLGFFDFTSFFGSSGRLKSFLDMNSLNLYPADPTTTFLGTNSTLDVFGQEAGHRWLAFTGFLDAGLPNFNNLGRQFAHWSFFMDSDASVMEGNNWVPNSPSPGLFTSDAATERYSRLDQYIMGLGPASDVSPSPFLVDSPSNCMAGGSLLSPQPTRSSPPQIGVTCNGSQKNFTVDDIIALNGARTPPFGSSPNTFSQAFILLVPEGQAASSVDLAKLDGIRQAWINFFKTATDGRGSVVTAAQPNLPPTGFVDFAGDNLTSVTTMAQTRTMRVSGWAADNEDGSPVQQVLVTVDGFTFALADLFLPRPDVAAAVGRPEWTSSGWTALINTRFLSVGTHQIGAIAIDKQGARTVLNGTRTIIITANQPPFGFVDVAGDATTGSSTIPQNSMLRVSGWAADPELGAPVAEVVIVIDGRTTVFARTALPRPDVAGAFSRSDFLASGFEFTMPAGQLTPGTHEVRVIAADSTGLFAQLPPVRTFAVTATSNNPPLGFTDQAVHAPVLIDFEQFVGPSVFTGAQPPLTIGLATFFGGQVLSRATFSPVDQTTIYGTADFCPGCSPIITISFIRPVSNASLFLINGQPVTVTYTVQDDRGNLQNITLPSNIAAGASTVTLPAPNIRRVTITTTGGGPTWDFLIDNVRFEDPSTVFNAFLNEVLRVTGWSADLDSSPEAPVVSVTIRIDGRPVGDARRGLPRPDVAAALGRSGALNSGWEMLVDTAGLRFGFHTVDAVATDSAGLSTVLPAAKSIFVFGPF